MMTPLIGLADAKGVAENFQMIWMGLDGWMGLLGKYLRLANLWHV